MQYITKEEYNNYFRLASRIEDDELVFSSCCGPHEWRTKIYINGNVGYLHWGWDVEEDTDPNSEYTAKNVCWWGINGCIKDSNQEGDGI